MKKFWQRIGKPRDLKNNKGRSFVSVEDTPNGRSMEKGNVGDKIKKGEKGSLERPLFFNRKNIKNVSASLILF